MKKSSYLFALSLLAIGLTSCAVNTSESGNEPATTLADQLPPEWTDDERSIWKVMSATHPEVKVLDLRGKRALMTMPHDVCVAYDEGYSRKEIASVLTSSGSVSSAFNDDLMTLGVTYFCPQHMESQLK